MSSRVTPVTATGIVVAALGMAALGSVGARRDARAGAARPEVDAGLDAGGGVGLDAGTGRERESAAARALRRGQRLDINTSSASDLQLLPGIGPTLSERIARVRRDAGAFDTLGELEQVSGIGPKTIEDLRSLARVGRPGAPRDGGQRTDGSRK